MIEMKITADNVTELHRTLQDILSNTVSTDDYALMNDAVNKSANEPDNNNITPEINDVIITNTGQFTDTSNTIIKQHVPNELGTDSVGNPWDERIHSTAKNKNANGTWKIVRRPKSFDNNPDGWKVYIKDVLTGLNSEDPTPAPTPTEDPVPAPTEDPTPAPTPTEDPVPAPTEDPTPAPTPTEDPVPAPTEDPVPAPTEDPTPAPTPTEDPVPAPTEDPAPAPAPTENPVPAPSDLGLFLAFMTTNASVLSIEKVLEVCRRNGVPELMMMYDEAYLEFVPAIFAELKGMVDANN